MDTIEVDERNNFYRFITCSTEISTETVGYVLQDYLDRTNQTLEDFLNTVQHDLYHLCFNSSRCCQCPKGYHHLPKRRVLYEDELAVLFDPHIKRVGHRASGLRCPTLCCSKTKKGIQLKALDLTLLRSLMVNCCTDLLWECCLRDHRRDKSVSLKDFLQKNKHVIYHHYKCNVACCQCPSGYVYPSDTPMLTEDDWKILFPCKQNPCPLHSIHFSPTLCCSVDVDPAITLVRIDQHLQIKLLHIFSELKKYIETLCKFRNMYFHHAKCTIPTDEFNQNWNELEHTIFNCLHAGISDKQKSSVLKKKQSDKLAVTRSQKIDDSMVRRKRIEDATQKEIEVHIYNKTYVETAALRRSRDILEMNKVLILTGSAGSGKSANALELLKTLKEKNTLVLKLTCQNIQDLSYLCNFSSKVCILLEDIFGRTNVTFDEKVDDILLQNIQKYLMYHDHMAILTIRSSIMPSCEVALESRGLLNCIVNLSKDFDLKASEKLDILHSYARAYSITIDETVARSDEMVAREGGQIIINKRLLNEICDCDTMLGFPENCRLFFSVEDFTMLGLSFFKHPTTSLVQSIEKYRKGMKNGIDCFQYKMMFTTLVYAVLNEDEFSIYDVDLVVVNNIMTSVYSGRAVEFIEPDILDAADELKGELFTYSGGIYSLQHRIVSEAILLSYAKCNFRGIVSTFGADFILEMVKPATYREMRSEIILRLPEKHYIDLARRILKIMSENPSIAFVECTLSKCGMMHDFKFLETLLQAYNSQNFEPSFKHRFEKYIGYSLTYICKSPNEDCIKFLWDYMIQESQKSEAESILRKLCSCFILIDSPEKSQLLDWMLENSTQNFREYWLRRVFGEKKQTFYFKKVLSDTIKAFKNKQASIIHVQTILNIACQTNFMLVFKECISLHKYEGTCDEINIKELFILACKNVDDGIDIVNYFRQNTPASVRENTVDACRAAMQSDNLNIVSFFIKKKLIDVTNCMILSFETGRIYCAQHICNTYSEVCFDFERALQAAFDSNQLEIIDWYARLLTMKNPPLKIKNPVKTYHLPFLLISYWVHGVENLSFHSVFVKVRQTGVRGINLLSISVRNSSCPSLIIGKILKTIQCCDFSDEFLEHFVAECLGVLDYSSVECILNEDSTAMCFIFQFCLTKYCDAGHDVRIDQFINHVMFQADKRIQNDQSFTEELWQKAATRRNFHCLEYIIACTSGHKYDLTAVISTGEDEKQNVKRIDLAEYLSRIIDVRNLGRNIEQQISRCTDLLGILLKECPLDQSFLLSSYLNDDFTSVMRKVTNDFPFIPLNPWLFYYIAIRQNTMADILKVLDFKYIYNSKRELPHKKLIWLRVHHHMKEILDICCCDPSKKWDLWWIADGIEKAIQETVRVGSH